MVIVDPLSMGWLPWKTSVSDSDQECMVNDPICEPIDDDEPQTVAANGFLQVLSQLLLLPLLLLLLLPLLVLLSPF